MTDRDVLKRASEALRESSEPSADELLKLRQRVLGGGNVLPLARAQKRKTVRWVLPLAAAFVAGSALAATPGAWEGMLNSVERFLDIELLAPSHQAMPKAKPGKKSAAAVGVVKSADAVAVVEPVVEAAPVAEAGTSTSTPMSTSTPTSTRTRTRTRTATASVMRADAEVAVAEPVVPELSGPSRDVALYKAAHELHFGARRYDQALHAWESYLALPSPTFTLEARYNRALCLLHLGHFEEARAALRPFAEGRVLGSYRRDEASRLIQALDKRR